MNGVTVSLVGRDPYDYNWDSVTLGVSARRPSRIPVMMNVRDCLRDSIHALPSLRERMSLTMLVQSIHQTNTLTFSGAYLQVGGAYRSAFFNHLSISLRFLWKPFIYAVKRRTSTNALLAQRLCIIATFYSDTLNFTRDIRKDHQKFQSIPYSSFKTISK